MPPGGARPVRSLTVHSGLLRGGGGRRPGAEQAPGPQGEHGHQEGEDHHRRRPGDVLGEDRVGDRQALRHTDDDPADERAGQAGHPAEHGGGERRDQRREGHEPGPEAAGQRGGEDPAEPAEEGRHAPGEAGQPLGADAHQLGGQRVLAEAEDGQAEIGAGEEQGAGHGQRRQGGDDQQALVGDGEAEHRHPVEPAQRRGQEPQLALAEPQLGADGEQRHPGRRHQQRHPGGGEQRPDHEPFGGQPAGQGGHQPEQHGDPVGHADGVGAPQGEDGHRAELPLGEVEDAARLVDEHEPERDQPVAGTGDDADDQCLAHGVDLEVGDEAAGGLPAAGGAVRLQQVGGAGPEPDPSRCS